MEFVEIGSMKAIKSWFTIVSVFVGLSGAGYVLVTYYSFIFAKTVSGKVLRVERVLEPGAIIATRGQTPSAEIFSFAIAIRDDSGETFTASTEDRQWAVIAPEQCVSAKLFRYPPWDLSKAGTFFGARLTGVFDCPAQ